MRKVYSDKGEKGEAWGERGGKAVNTRQLVYEAEAFVAQRLPVSWASTLLHASCAIRSGHYCGSTREYAIHPTVAALPPFPTRKAIGVFDLRL